MKKVILLILFAIGALIFTPSCKTVNVNKNGVPPGQAKKITGSQSAKQYAPGQNK